MRALRSSAMHSVRRAFAAAHGPSALSGLPVRAPRISRAHSGSARETCAASRNFLGQARPVDTE